jgi:rfaE bifunctional protein nucleotidyltransferase chain/domain
MSKKIIPQNATPLIVKDLKKQGKKIVTYNGSFDILHAGHVESIREAKQQGDILIILLNSDKSVKLYKGPTRPINNQEIRAKAILSLDLADYIIVFDEINPKKVLDLIKPDIHCCGSDWGKNCIERKIVEENGGKIYVLKWKKGFSTTDIIKKKFGDQEKSSVKAIFLDRDGTINDNKGGYIYKIKDFEFLPGVIEGLKKLSKTDYFLIVITNQSGIGRGMYSDDDFQKLNKWLLNEVSGEGIRIDKIYHCPHHPDDKCDCRKPEIGLFLKAVRDFGINLSKSWFIGNSDSDVISGREANIKTIKIGDKVNSSLKLEPNYYVKNFEEAVNIIL